ncbi:TetR family transcriptional regulator C-terminal domain-containing protein [Curtobacterium flaccumfaciens]|uniref:TetR family transcriptional regulator C-terminal domain-containing protein n=1 Tax=Curtobacterium flaccumfaciens TaxID=2035 RepID=UPI001FB7D89C|nr:TetR family transcriptional regulator C-terminal domain-containing protein [Curtobacterium flaccumfaciens]
MTLVPHGNRDPSRLRTAVSRKTRSEGTETALDKAKVAGGLIDSVDVSAAAIELTALMDGLQVMWLLDPDGIDMAAQVRRAVQRLLVFPL